MFNLKNVSKMKNLKNVSKMKKLKVMWKVEYYNSFNDRLKDIRTVSEFDNFEDAKDLTNILTGGGWGAVRLIHPD